MANSSSTRSPARRTRSARGVDPAHSRSAAADRRAARTAAALAALAQQRQRERRRARAAWRRVRVGAPHGRGDRVAEGELGGGRQLERRAGDRTPLVQHQRQSRLVADGERLQRRATSRSGLRWIGAPGEQAAASASAATMPARRPRHRHGSSVWSRSMACTGAASPCIRWAMAPYTSCCWRDAALARERARDHADREVPGARRASTSMRASGSARGDRAPDRVAGVAAKRWASSGCAAPSRLGSRRHRRGPACSCRGARARRGRPARRSPPRPGASCSSSALGCLGEPACRRRRSPSPWRAVAVAVLLRLVALAHQVGEAQRRRRRGAPSRSSRAASRSSSLLLDALAASGARARRSPRESTWPKRSVGSDRVRVARQERRGSPCSAARTSCVLSPNSSVVSSDGIATSTEHAVVLGGAAAGPEEQRRRDLQRALARAAAA